ncbi:MAG: hypothetical protein FJ278_03780, partial [Planctomycetes bacterium]|nr:hypothetical protein [Planctomycetota bacterium]
MKEGMAMGQAKLAKSGMTVCLAVTWALASAGLGQQTAITGKVVASDGKTIVAGGQMPIEGVMFYFHKPGEPVKPFGSRHADLGQTDEKGNIVIWDPPEPGKWILVGQLGRRIVYQREIEVQAGKVLDLVVQLPELPVLEGQLLDEEGEHPVEGAELWLVSPAVAQYKHVYSMQDQDERVVRTDEQGRFRILAPPEGDCSIFLSTLGEEEPVLLARITVDPKRPEPVVLRAKMTVGIVPGRVLDTDGRPLRRATLKFRLASERDKETQTDAEGGFTLRPPIGPFEGGHVIAPGKGYAVLPRFSVTKDRRPPIELRLTPLATVSGVVRDEKGNPLAKREVSIWLSRFMGFGWRSGQRAVTDHLGRFAFSDLLPGEYRISHGGPGEGSEVLWLIPGENRSGLVLTASPKPTREQVRWQPKRFGLKGRVLLPDGSPAAKATVCADLPPPGISTHGTGPRPPHNVTTTDETGRFCFEDVEPGRHMIAAHIKGHATLHERVRMESGGKVALANQAHATDELVLKMPDQAGRITGRVFEPGKVRPLVGARVFAFHGVYLEPMWDAQRALKDLSVTVDEKGKIALLGPAGEIGLFPKTESDADGKFELGDLTLGTYLLAAVAKDFSVTVGRDVRVQAGTAAEVTLEKDMPIETKFMGRLIDEGGRSLAGLDVWVEGFCCEREPPVTSDENGLIPLNAREPGRYDIEVTAEGYAERAVNGIVVGPGIRIDEPLIRMRRLRQGTATVRVMDLNGHPMPNVWITPFASVGGFLPEFAKFTDQSGLCRLEGLREGDYRFVAAAGAGKPFAAAISDKVQVALSELHPVTPTTIVLRGFGSLSGNVIGADGKPVAGAHVSLYVDEPWDMRSGEGRYVVTEGDGTFRFAKVPPGKCTLHASLWPTETGYAQTARSRRVDVRTGEETKGVELRIRPPWEGGKGRAEGKVLLPDGRPAAGLTVVPFPAWVGPMQDLRPTDEAGQFAFDMQPGEGTFEVCAEGYALAILKAHIRPGVTTILPPHTLSPGGRIEGDVKSALGLPVRGVTVRLAPAMGSPDELIEVHEKLPTGLSDDEGRFRIDHLPAGKYLAYGIWGHVIRTEPRLVTVRDGMAAAVSLKIVPLVRTVAGRVTEKDGMPLQRSPAAAADSSSVSRPAAGQPEITLIPADFACRSFEFRAKANEYGAFEMHNVPPGVYHAKCEAHGRASVTKLSVPIRKDLTDLKFALPVGGTVVGRVLNKGGRAL